MIAYCIENENIMTDYPGIAYFILDQLFSLNPFIKKLGLLHLVLFPFCFYMDKTVTLGGRPARFKCCVVGRDRICPYQLISLSPLNKFIDSFIFLSP